MENLAAPVAGAKFSHAYVVECFDRAGRLKWREDIRNLTTNVGLDEILDKFWKGSSYSASFSVGLTDGTPTPAAGDTMASHAGWTEVTDYDESTREALTLGSVASQSVDNSASKASFAINTTVTIGGAFIGTNNTKGGTTGILVGVAAFSSDREAEDGDVLNVTCTLTAANA